MHMKEAVFKIIGCLIAITNIAITLYEFTNKQFTLAEHDLKEDQSILNWYQNALITSIIFIIFWCIFTLLLELRPQFIASKQRNYELYKLLDNYKLKGSVYMILGWCVLLGCSIMNITLSIITILFGVTQIILSKKIPDSTEQNIIHQEMFDAINNTSTIYGNDNDIEREILL